MIDIVSRIKLLGILAIIISLFTWYLELSGYVNVCRYCQVQRTTIGLLGILMVLPHIPSVSALLSLMIALMGTHVSCAQLFLHVKEGRFEPVFSVLAFAALAIMCGQIILLFNRAIAWKKRNANSNHIL